MVITCCKKEDPQPSETHDPNCEISYYFKGPLSEDGYTFIMTNPTTSDTFKLLPPHNSYNRKYSAKEGQNYYSAMKSQHGEEISIEVQKNGVRLKKEYSKDTVNYLVVKGVIPVN